MAECPNVAKLLSNITFDVPLENEGMGFLIRDSLPAADAAKKALTAHPEYLDAWLAGVTTVDGKDALPAVKEALGL